MGRRIIYRIEEREENTFSESEWNDVLRLQHWYNSEFTWTAGKIAFKRYVLFPNAEDFSDLDVSVWELIARRHQSLQQEGRSDEEIVRQLERDRLVTVKWGGYFDQSLASGFTRVADNEWNAYLVCEFLLKASTILKESTIVVSDEGKFIKTGRLSMRDGVVLLEEDNIESVVRGFVDAGHIFSLVNPGKYDKHPAFKNIIPEFNSLKKGERRAVVRNWNWLGYEDGYDVAGDDIDGFDLNSKVRAFRLLRAKK
jgi:hypothetical protein